MPLQFTSVLKEYFLQTQFEMEVDINLDIFGWILDFNIQMFSPKSRSWEKCKHSWSSGMTSMCLCYAEHYERMLVNTYITQF